MDTVLSEGAVNQIISLLGVKKPEYTEIYLTNAEIEALYKLSLQQKDLSKRMCVRTSNTSGIGINVKVIVDNQEKDITDYDAW